MKRIRLGAAILVLAGCSTTAISDPAPDRHAVPRTPEPSTFVAVRGFEQHQVLALLSTRTGKPVRVLARTGMDFTNNGLDRSPDGRWIYATWIGTDSLRIERMSATGGPRTLIAYGSEPVISPDGRYLAYVPGRNDLSVAVRDLRTGRTRLWNLGSTVSSSGSLSNGELFWLGSGELAVHPGIIFTADRGSRSAAKRKSGGCGSAPDASDCLVHFDPAQAHPGIEHVVIGPGSSDREIISGGTAAPHSAVLWRHLGAKTEIELCDVRTGHRTHPATVQGMALALDRSGTHLLYLVDHSPPALWSAELRDGRLLHRHRILADGRIAGGVDW